MSAGQTTNKVNSKPAAPAEDRELAIERLVEMLRQAVKRLLIRKKTQVCKGAKLRRLEQKKQHGMLKGQMSKVVPVDD